MPMDIEQFREVLKDKVEQESTKQTIYPTFAEMVSQGLIELELEEKNKKLTNAFFLPALKGGHLYTVIAPSNAGKTWFSLSTALSLAREGRKVFYVSTEDSSTEIASYLEEMYKATEDKSFLENIYWNFTTNITKDALHNLLVNASQVAEAMVLDYVRPDFIELPKATDSLYMLVSDFYEVVRNFLANEGRQFSIIQTIQANPEMYRADILKELMENPNRLATMIDGGNTTFRRSQVVAILYYNEIEKQRYIIPIKAKHTDYKHRNQLIRFSVNTATFAIEYPRDLDGSLYYEPATNIMRTGISTKQAKEKRPNTLPDK
jgi:hypothetical protein